MAATTSTKPMLVAMKGHPGTGKSRLAAAIARAQGWPLIDKDDVRDCLVLLEASPASPSSGRPSAKRLNAVSYDVMWRVAESQLRLGLGVVVDCPLAYPWLLDDGRTVAKRQGVPMVVVECRASDSSAWKDRLEERARSAMSSRSSSPADEGQQDEQDEQTRRLVWAEGLLRLQDLPARVAWHKHSTWEELEAKLRDYAGCWDYHLGPDVKHLVVDSTACICQLDLVLDWIKGLDDEDLSGSSSS